MKPKILFILINLIIIPACTNLSLELSPMTPTIIPSSTTTPTKTMTPEPTTTQTATATPEPYYLEKGKLYNYENGEYRQVTEQFVKLDYQLGYGIVAVNVYDAPLFAYQSGEWVELPHSLRWRYTANDAAHSGQKDYDFVMEFLSHPENIPTNEDIVRLITPDGNLPFGKGKPETSRDYGSSGSGRKIDQYSFVLGGTYLTATDPYRGTEWYNLLLFYPDDPDNFEAGGKMLIMLMKVTDERGWGGRVFSVEPGGMRDDNWSWEVSYYGNFNGAQLAKFFIAGLNNEMPLFGAQVTIIMLLNSGDYYAAVGGYIAGNTGDTNGDGVSEDGGPFTFTPGYPIGIPIESMTPELLLYLEEIIEGN